MTGRELPRRGIESRPLPAWLMRRVVNPVVRLVALSPLGRWTGDLVLIEFVTRRTGRRLRIPVLLHRLGPALLVFTDGSWAANFRDARPVTVIRRGRRHDGEAILSDDPDGTAAALRAVLAQQSSPRRLGLTVAPGYQPTDVELATLRHMIRVSLTT